MSINKKQALLILDSFSHLVSIDSVGALDLLLIQSILKAYPKVKHHLGEYLTGIPDTLPSGEPNEAKFTRIEIAELGDTALES